MCCLCLFVFLIAACWLLRVVCYLLLSVAGYLFIVVCTRPCVDFCVLFVVCVCC